MWETHVIWVLMQVAQCLTMKESLTPDTKGSLYGYILTHISVVVFIHPSTPTPVLPVVNLFLKKNKKKA